MQKNQSSFNWRSEIFLASALVALSVLTRFLPHPPNFSPVLALGLFSGAVFSDRRMAFILPLAALFISDAILGFYDGMSFVYLAYALTIVLGRAVRPRKLLPVALSAVGSSVIFFVLSNLGVWFFSGLYAQTFSGLTECFIMALPFFHNTLISTLSGAAVLFGVYSRLKARRPVAVVGA